MAVVNLQHLSYVATAAVRESLSNLESTSFRLGDNNLFFSGSRLHEASTQFLIQANLHSEVLGLLG